MTGLREAREYGFVLIEFSFEDVTKHLCESVTLTFAEMFRLHNITGMSDPPTKSDCVEEIGHTQTSHLQRSMEGRIGTSASKRLRQWLNGTWAE